MAVDGFPARSALAALVLAGSFLSGGGADAATIYNYSFVQTGYDNNPVYGLGPAPATVSGTFSGTLNAGGSIDPSTLTDFHLTFAYDGEKQGRIEDISSGDGTCTVRMAQLGPYIAVVDNNAGGGLNVTFTGLYFRQ